VLRSYCKGIKFEKGPLESWNDLKRVLFSRFKPILFLYDRSDLNCMINDSMKSTCLFVKLLNNFC
jgi:hypothetical protein